MVRQEFDGTCEIIVVDNASTDGTQEYLMTEFPGIRILQMSRNLGYADGCNAALGHATGDNIVILNDDVEVEQNWLAELIKAATEHPEYNILASIDQHNAKRDFNYFLMVMLVRQSAPSRSVFSSLFASGACFLIRRKWLQKIGYLFEPYFYYEDAELSLRTVLLGGDIAYVPTSRLRHFSGSELSIRTSEEVRQKTLNVYRFALRHRLKAFFTFFSIPNFLKLVLLQQFFLLDFILTPWEIPTCSLAMIRGTIEGIFEIGTVAGKRREFQGRKERSDGHVFQRLNYGRSSLIQRAIISFLQH